MYRKLFKNTGEGLLGKKSKEKNYRETQQLPAIKPNIKTKQKTAEEQAEEESGKQVNEAICGKKSIETVAINLHKKGMELKESGKDYLAIVYFEAAARLNHQLSLNMLGLMYYYGYRDKYGHIVKDKDLAKSYYQQSAELGNKNAKDILKLWEMTEEVDEEECQNENTPGI